MTTTNHVRPVATDYVLHLSTPDVGKAEEEAVVRALRSGWVAPLGHEVDAFEAELASLANRKHALAVNSGTAALHLALVCSGVHAGDYVLCSTMTFVATANAILYVGAVPFFVDCDESGNMDVNLLSEALSWLSNSGAAVGAIVAVDMLGKVADYDSLCALGVQYDLPIVSDAAESVGSSRDGYPAGSFGLCAAFSFNGNKIITTGGGGALLCDDPGLLEHARYLSAQARQPVSHYEHTDMGYNYRLSNVLAAVGRAQLQRLPDFLARRQEIRSSYRATCELLPGVDIFGGVDKGDNCWLTGIVIDDKRAGFSARSLGHYLQARRIETRPLWKPMHLQPLFADEKSVPRIANGTSERFFRQGLVLPSSANLTAEQLDRVVHHIWTYATRAPLHVS
jgi:dTDP-4-amino-4,6-dideoxygalactose transaminase